MLKHIILLFGDDPFSIRKTVERWKKAFVEKHGDINLDIFEGKTPTNQIVEATQAIPFLGEKRLIIVKDFMSEQDSEEQKKMVERLKDIPDSTVVLLWENFPPDKRTSLFKILQKNARLEEFKPLIGDDLTRWIIKTIEERQVAREKARNGFADPSAGLGGMEGAKRSAGPQLKLDWPTATYLASLLPTDTWQLHNEIEKLLLYAGNDPITKETIDKVVTSAQSTTIFRLTDALGQCQSKEAIRNLHQLVDKGEEIPMIFGMLVRQIRLLMQIHELSTAGYSPGSIATTLKVHPYAVSTIFPQCKNFTLEKLKTLYGRLLNIDVRLKTGAFSYTANNPGPYLLELETFLIEATM